MPETKGPLTELERLALICEAIRYCQRVRGKGMMPAAWSKALREPVYFLWETRNGNKMSAARYRSLASEGLRWGTRELVYDHAVPFVLVQDALMALIEPSPESVRGVLDRMLVACIITREEDRTLSGRGLGKKMPEGWDGADQLARYRYLDIPVGENPAYVTGEVPTHEARKQRRRTDHVRLHHHRLLAGCQVDQRREGR